MIRILTLTTAIFAGAPVAAQESILSLGGSVTEILVELGQEDQIVARDTTSTWPERIQSLPDVGYLRQLSPEGVLSAGADMIISEHDAGPPETVEILKAAELDFVIIPEALDSTGIAAKVRAVGAAADLSEAAEELARTPLAQLDEAQTQAALRAGETPRGVLFILSLQRGRIMAAGQGIAADAIQAMAGAENAVQGVRGYKQLRDEAAAAASDAILMMDRSDDHGATDATLLSMPAIGTTPVAETGTIIRMDGGYLLGFGLRTAAAVSDLSHALYGSRDDDDRG